MAKRNQDFTLFASTDLPLRIEDIRNEQTGALVQVGDILGASWGATPYGEGDNPIISKDLTTGGILVPEDGVVVVLISKSDTASIKEETSEFTHELRLKHSAGEVVACDGKMTVVSQKSKSPL